MPRRKKVKISSNLTPFIPSEKYGPDTEVSDHVNFLKEAGVVTTFASDEAERVLRFQLQALQKTQATQQLFEPAEAWLEDVVTAVDNLFKKKKKSPPASISSSKDAPSPNSSVEMVKEKEEAERGTTDDPDCSTIVLLPKTPSKKNLTFTKSLSDEEMPPPRDVPVVEEPDEPQEVVGEDEDHDADDEGVHEDSLEEPDEEASQAHAEEAKPKRPSTPNPRRLTRNMHDIEEENETSFDKPEAEAAKPSTPPVPRRSSRKKPGAEEKETFAEPPEIVVTASSNRPISPIPRRSTRKKPGAEEDARPVREPQALTAKPVTPPGLERSTGDAATCKTPPASPPKPVEKPKAMPRFNSLHSASKNPQAVPPGVVRSAMKLLQDSKKQEILNKKQELLNKERQVSGHFHSSSARGLTPGSGGKFSSSAIASTLSSQLKSVRPPPQSSSSSTVPKKTVERKKQLADAAKFFKTAIKQQNSNSSNSQLRQMLQAKKKEAELRAKKEAELRAKKEAEAKALMMAAAKEKHAAAATKGGDLQQQQHESVHHSKPEKENNLNSTFTKPSTETSSYDITPARHELPPEPLDNPDNYNIDNLNSEEDTDDEEAPRKQIPAWALGNAFHMAIMQQSYNPPDVDQIFAQIEMLPLEVIFKYQKKRFYKRTSSAQWGKMPESHKFM